MSLNVEVYSEYQITCDHCGYLEIGHSNGEFYDLNHFKKVYRADGWSIGNRILCPDCSGKKWGENFGGLEL